MGHLVSAKGIRAYHKKISRAKQWARPTNRKDVLQFLGFAGYYKSSKSSLGLLHFGGHPLPFHLRRL